MENACAAVERTNSREGDQASYFYVVWPEETVTTLSSTTATMDPNSLCNHRSAAQLHRHQQQNRNRREPHLMQQDHHELMEHPSASSLSPTGGGRGRLSEIEVGGFASPLTSPILSIADASPLVQVAHSGAAVLTSPKDVCMSENLPDAMNEGSSFAGTDINQEDGSLSQSSCDSSGTSQPNSPKFPSHNYHSSDQQLSSSSITMLSVGGGRGVGGGVRRGVSKGVSSHHPTSSQAPDIDAQFKDHNCSSVSRRKRSRSAAGAGVQYYNLNGCLECEVKDAEIKTLRRRIQVMEEVAALLQQKVSALQQSSSNRSVLFSPVVMPPVVSQVVIPSTYAPPHTTSIKMSASSNHCITANTSPHSPSDNEDASSDSVPIAYAQAELCSPAEQRVELISGSGVYVTLPRLEEARREAKNGTQLARKLMDAFWDRETLARSSLSSKSKYQYQQLDPNVINAIEAYCLNFDSSTHSRDLHACMTDKCCQARSRRGAPFKAANAALHNGIQHHQQANGVAHNGVHVGINSN